MISRGERQSIQSDTKPRERNGEYYPINPRRLDLRCTDGPENIEARREYQPVITGYQPVR